MGKYKIIYADPPWRFKNFSVKGERRNAISKFIVKIKASNLPKPMLS